MQSYSGHLEVRLCSFAAVLDPEDKQITIKARVTKRKGKRCAGINL